jgi:predicted kinase
MLVMMMGRTAAGKTTLSKFLTEELGTTFISTSQIRDEMIGSFATKECLDEKLRSTVYDEAIHRCSNSINFNQSSIIDAAFHRTERRLTLYENIFKKLNTITIIYCTCSNIEKIKQRLNQRASASNIVDNRAFSFDVYSHISNNFEELTKSEFEEYKLKANVIYVDTDINQIQSIEKYGNPKNNSNLNRLCGLINKFTYNQSLGYA